ncbi:RNA polymerase sigma factor [Robertmurraya korlensis]|uniref:RNA polymerase sigma factor n=1 Tax=Robertmurraya korlensis TaxID=519977 RepID=UPI000825BA3A|nr:sigma-70 family RNA polymerase sigma factor [Robertmurraya korlensis]
MVDLDNLEDSISSIYKHYYLDVFRFLVCFSGSQQDAEDMTQEVFIRVLNNLKNFDCTRNLKAWIFTIARNVAVDTYRRKRFTSIFKEGFFKKLESKEKGPNEKLEDAETVSQIHLAISNLKPQFRAVVILRGINEFSIKETAEILKCSETKVKVNYHRALQDLKKKLHIHSEEVFSNAK